MKKLLYTLFAFTIIVACEKDMDDNYDSSSINPIDAQVGISEKEAVDLFNSLLGEISTVSEENLFYVAPKRVKGQANTARTSDGSCGDDRPTTGDYITLTYFQNSNDRGVLVRSEERGNVTIPDSQVSLELTYSLSGTTYSIRNEGTGFNIATGLAASPALQASFPAPLNLVYRVDASNSPQALLTGALRTAVGIDCTPSPSTGSFDWQLISGSTDTYENTDPAITATYRLSPAPFPLTGMLATIVTADSDNASANYAGTSSSTVRDAIEDDIEGI